MVRNPGLSGVIGALVRRLLTTAGQVAALLRRVSIRLSYPEIEFGRDIAIARGAILKATDGGRICLGDRVAIGQGATIVAKHGTILIGADSYIGSGVVIVCRQSIEIGPDALIAEHVIIRDQDHAFAALDRPIREQGFEVAPVIIGPDVWLGAGTAVLKGVSIGAGAVIGAGSVVTRDLPDLAVVAGVPARVLSYRGTAGSGESPSAAPSPNGRPLG
jgi:acetyltransferase-like isoleucine patch superfamily enzyme